MVQKTCTLKDPASDQTLLTQLVFTVNIYAAWPISLRRNNALKERDRANIYAMTEIFRNSGNIN